MEVRRDRAPGPWLSLDVGDTRIGVAVSESGVIAKTLPALHARGKSARLDAIEALVARYGARCLLVGLPVLEGGAEGAQAAKTRAFARSLARRLPAVEIVYWDERYTSAEARDILGPSAGDLPAGRIDSVAAAVLLQEYLDHTAP